MPEPQVKAFGTWTSPISADLIAKTAISYDDVLVDSVTSKVYHVEKRPNEGGRNVVVETHSGKDAFDKNWNARTGVQEYGGASTLVYDGVVYFSHFVDNKVYKVEAGKQPVAVTPDNKNYRYADFVVHPTSPHLLVSILEDHTHPKPSEVATLLVTLNTRTSTISPLVSGTDFYSSPAFSADGKRLAWVQWKHPDMPWEGAEVYVADAEVGADALKLKNIAKVKGEWKTLSAVQPQWADNNTLLFTCDASGYQNPWIVDLSKPSHDARAVLKEKLAQDFGEPGWRLGDSCYALLSAHTALFTAFKDGRSTLYLVDTATGMYKEIASPYVHVTNIRKLNDKSVVFLGEATDAPKAIVQCELDSAGSAKFSIAKGGDESSVSKSYFAAPVPISFTESGEPLYVVFYKPTNPEFVGPQGEKPPCVVSVHGGPTGMSTQGLSMRQQYFTSRGFAWVEVNYGGSSGYGRKYIERLAGQWGITDVHDCIQSVKALAGDGVIDAKRVAITGGSAGGYTVLSSLCAAGARDVFAAGTSSYGVSDLFKLTEDTHKFESRYLEKLLGGTPETAEKTYKERSPVFHADKIKSPLLILQGADDMVVPPSQAEEMKKVIEENGGRVEYKLFQGEGHGWRKAETIIAALEAELAFYVDVLKLNNSS